MSPTLLKLNQIAQGLVAWSEGMAWFRESPSTEKESILRDLANITIQSHPRAEEIEPAIQMAGLKHTFTPCVLVSKVHAPERAVHKILMLPEAEWEKSFQLLIALLSVADARRRATHCDQGCSHDWHQLRRP